MTGAQGLPLHSKPIDALANIGIAISGVWSANRKLEFSTITYV